MYDVRMFEYNGKQYKVILWDWLYTLYNPDSCGLYVWVTGLFEKIDPETQMFMVSFAKHPDMRKRKIEDSAIAERFIEIVIDTQDKTVAYQNLQAENNWDPASVLVIGDNVNHEGQAAAKLGYTYVHVWEFAKSLGYIHE